MLSFSTATQGDAPALFTLGKAVAEDLTRRYGRGPWSSTEKHVPLSMPRSRIVIGRKGKSIVGMLRLSTRESWAPEVYSWFTSVKKALYLTDVAVIPALQRQGIGRMLLKEAVKQARAWPADAIRLDTFTYAGAGAFYAKCGFREVGRAMYLKVPFILWLIYFELVL